MILIVSALASVALMLWHGRNNSHLSVTLLFVAWTLAPYAVYGVGLRIGAKWPADVKAWFTRAVTVVAALSVLGYLYGAFGPPLKPAAVVFVMWPAIVDTLVGLVLTIAISKAALPTSRP